MVFRSRSVPLSAPLTETGKTPVWGGVSRAPQAPWPGGSGAKSGIGVTNKGWVLGTDRFRKAVEEVLDRPTAPRPKGGDRRSKAYRESIK